LFKAQGFEATTVEQIVARVETSPRTFFRYFGSKEDVVFGDTPERLSSLRQRLEAATDEQHPIALLKDALLEQIDNFTNFDDPGLEAACAELWISEPALRRRYIEIVLEWENVIATYLARCWNDEPTSVRCRLTSMAVIAAVRVCLERGAESLEVAHQALSDGYALLEHGIYDPG